jgi:ParB-like chromosome segregation protein Spo0J
MAEPKEAKGPKVTDETRPLASLKPDPRNARRHSTAQVRQIASVIEELGYVDKIIIHPDGQIVGGEGRWLALKQLERESVECRVVAGLSEAQYGKLALALNKLGENSSWDDDALRDIVGDLDEADINLRDLFSDKELGKLLNEPDDIEVREVETSTVEDEFWISVRGPLPHQAEALKALEAALKPFKGVSVELGTIAIG